ncbi:hypothetical protein BSKO_09473 [Bryopsis sp. KO-2023]|nr:hypothetical protein BSKO_09473 [Bryopsis sp. KO-2023]
MSGNSSVDDIWAQLKSSSVPKRPARKKNVTPLSGSSDRRKDTLANPAEVVPIESKSGKTQAPIPPEGGVQEYIAVIQRDINCLSDPDRSIRSRAITKLSKKLLEGDGGTPPANEEILQALFLGPMLHSTVNLLSDPAEKCREASLQLLTTVLPRISEVGPLAAAIFPAIANRMGKIPVQEGTEELRLMLVKLVGGPLMEKVGSSLKGYVDELALHLCRAMEDPFHEVKKAGSSAIVKMCELLPSETVEPKSKELVKSVMGASGHQHSRVRVACLQALDALVLKGVSAGVVADIIGPGVENLAVDQSKQVRKACFEFLAGWMGGRGPAVGPEILSGGVDPVGYAPHLMPVLLLGLTDDEVDIAELCLEMIEETGRAFCEMSDRPQSQTQGDSSAMDIEQETTEAEVTSTTPSEATLVDFLGVPFRRNPSATTRRMIVSIIPGVLPGILESLKSWSNEGQRRASRVVHSVACLGQSGCETHFEKIMPAICGAVSEEDAQIADRVIRTVHVLGACIPVSGWLHLALDFLLSPRNGPPQKASGLVVVSGLLYAGALVHGAPKLSEVQMLTDGLRKEEIRCCDHMGLKTQLAAVVTNLIRLAGPLCQSVSQALYHLLLQLIGSGIDQTASGALSKLAEACGLENPHALAELHGRAILTQCTQDRNAWVDGSPGFQVFSSLLRWSGPQCLEAMMPEITQTLHEIITDHERDAALRLISLHLLDGILEDPISSTAFGSSHAKETLQKLLLPSLVWRAGKTAAAIRFAGITALATFLDGNSIDGPSLTELLETGEVLPLVFQMLEEDYYADTRVSACFVATRILQLADRHLTNDLRRAIYPELLKRLDDSSNRVRIAVCQTLQAFVHTLPQDYCETNTGYFLAPMLIHMDDSESEIQQAVCDVVLELAKIRPGVVRKEVGKVMDRFRCKEYCERVLVACGGEENATGRQESMVEG